MNDLAITNPARPVDPKRNPSYPQRTHTAEKAQWLALLAEWTKKVSVATSRLKVIGDHPKRAEFAFVQAQMQGSLDQIADSSRRLSGEVGEMYEEDKHKVDQAIVALERLLKKWDTLG